MLLGLLGNSMTENVTLALTRLTCVLITNTPYNLRCLSRFEFQLDLRLPAVASETNVTVSVALVSEPEDVCRKMCQRARKRAGADGDDHLHDPLGTKMEGVESISRLFPRLDVMLSRYDDQQGRPSARHPRASLRWVRSLLQSIGSKMTFFLHFILTTPHRR
ncbi:hypothetical protein SODALDRAFT_359007 [Sodiomyces alkalinus F11]|uniref:Uncharacterized protein n=1 Tax=Sodiomyces alkalinus (strain CBS 110278 / VKM F-3762 / F11) TaxID=1314773 RepID=A0A3N2PX85_SODAK|nr:hypothetical protein SODALDRAFT_359007 [Sodiomyces alkalinus F11]ROT39140.1 hypothetical protein SODALDRAFT_359007 [Sodiomyces alkalinus F11]